MLNLVLLEFFPREIVSIAQGKPTFLYWGARGSLCHGASTWQQKRHSCRLFTNFGLWHLAIVFIVHL